MIVPMSGRLKYSSAGLGSQGTSTLRIDVQKHLTMVESGEQRHTETMDYWETFWLQWTDIIPELTWRHLDLDKLWQAGMVCWLSWSRLSQCDLAISLYSASKFKEPQVKVIYPFRVSSGPHESQPAFHIFLKLCLSKKKSKKTVRPPRGLRKRT